MSTIGTRLKLLRGGQSLEIFSNNLGIHRVTLSRFEKNERIPDATFIQAVVEQTGVCSEWLIMGTEPMFNTVDSVKTADVSAVLEEKKPQHTENTSAITKETADTSAVLDAQFELSTAYKATAALQRELTDSIRENADLRVELERRKAQLRDLERENADLRKAMKPARLPGMDGQSVA